MESQPLTLETHEKQTRQRQEIWCVMQKACGPLSSFEIHRLVCQDIPHISLATIYRTLKILQRDGNVRPVILPDGVMRFESAHLGQHHFQCRMCHQIWTLNDDFIIPANEQKLINGFIIEDHNTTFYGCCPNCQKKLIHPEALNSQH